LLEVKRTGELLMRPQANSRPEAITPPEILLHPLHFLLRRYGRTPSPQVAGNIAQYVERLLNDRNFRVSPDERSTYQHMRTYWRLIERLGEST
jgi:hypothetical protein